MPAHYIWLFFAILSETLGTTALQASQQFSKFWPSVGVIVFYMLSFYCMSFALKAMPVGIVYAIWSGLGIVMIAGIGFLLFGQKLDLAALLGLALIIAGIGIIHLFSASSSH
ncbi:MAG: multidrug efflux SMR transporter [Sulfitobacter sp.]